MQGDFFFFFFLMLLLLRWKLFMHLVSHLLRNKLLNMLYLLSVIWQRARSVTQSSDQMKEIVTVIFTWWKKQHVNWMHHKSGALFNKLSLIIVSFVIEYIFYTNMLSFSAPSINPINFINFLLTLKCLISSEP